MRVKPGVHASTKAGSSSASERVRGHQRPTRGSPAAVAPSLSKTTRAGEDLDCRGTCSEGAAIGPTASCVAITVSIIG